VAWKRRTAHGPVMQLIRYVSHELSSEHIIYAYRVALYLEYFLFLNSNNEIMQYTDGSGKFY